MKNIVRIVIRLFTLYFILLFFTSLPMVINYIIEITSNNNANEKMNIIPFMIERIVYLLLPVVFWIKSESISNKISGNTSEEKIIINLTYKELLSFGIIFLSLFLIIIRIPILITLIIHNVSSYVTSPHLNWKNYLGEFISQLINQIIAIVIPILFIKYKEKIIGLFHKGNIE